MSQTDKETERQRDSETDRQTTCNLITALCVTSHSKNDYLQSNKHNMYILSINSHYFKIKNS